MALWPQAAALPASLEHSTLLVMDWWELQAIYTPGLQVARPAADEMAARLSVLQAEADTAWDRGEVGQHYSTAV